MLSFNNHTFMLIINFIFRLKHIAQIKTDIQYTYNKIMVQEEMRMESDLLWFNATLTCPFSTRWLILISKYYLMN